MSNAKRNKHNRISKMDGFRNVFCCFLVYFIFNFRSFCSADTCVPKGPCSCEFSNGTGIDLTPASANGTFYRTQSYKSAINDTQYDLNTYYYSPCFDKLLVINATAETDTCNKPLSICRHKNSINLNTTGGTYKQSGNKEFLGKTSMSNFSADGKSIAYFNVPSQTLVLLVCAQVDNNLEVYSEADPDSLILAFNSRDACLKQLNDPVTPGRSLGSTLLVIFFSIVILYLVLGICTKKFLMGATGLEVIPNLGFWSDLPNLVKDGWAFAINGFRLPARGPGPVSSPDPNSYDSI